MDVDQNEYDTPSPSAGRSSSTSTSNPYAILSSATASQANTTAGYDVDALSAVDTIGLPYDDTPNSGGAADDLASRAVSLLTDDFGTGIVPSLMAAEKSPLNSVQEEEGGAGELPKPTRSSIDDAEVGRKAAIKGDIYFDSNIGGEKNGEVDDEEITAYSGYPDFDLEEGTRGAASGLKEASGKDDHVDVEEAKGDLSDQPKGTNTASASDDMIPSSAAVIRGDREMASTYLATQSASTMNKNSTRTQPGAMFVPGPDFRGEILTGYNSAHEDSDEDANINGDIENQDQTLVEAYTVRGNDERAEIIDILQEELGSARNELEVARTHMAAPVVEGVPVSDVKDVSLLGNDKKKKILIGVVLFLGTMAVVVGLAVFFTNDKKKNNGDEPPIPEVSAAQVLPPVLKAVQERKVLRCGTHKHDSGLFQKEGFEVDLCKAVAAAALGSSYRYELVPVTGVDRFVKLANGEFDLLIAATTHTFERDVHELSSGVGFSFSTPYLYGGMTFNVSQSL